MALLLPVLGYLVATSLGVAALLWLLGERRAGRGALALAVLGPGLWYLFHHQFGLRPPTLVSGGAF